MPNISNMDDVIDSRDIIERIDELVELSKGEDWTVEDNDELTALQALAAQGADYAPDWEYGETLIRDSYFKEYAQELADDIGAIDRDAKWPTNCIDWDQAARELRMDYTAIDFDGVTYWVR
jgi:antirestriction protein